MFCLTLQVQNAWRANASAVLIYNDRDTTVLEKMKLSTDNGREYFKHLKTYIYFIFTRNIGANGFIKSIMVTISVKSFRL